MPLRFFCSAGNYSFFPDMDDLTDHLSRVRPLRAPATPAFPNTSISNVHKCDICQEPFQTADALASHRQIKKHPFAFVTLELLERHRSDAHSQRGREPSVANGCAKQFPSFMEWSQHSRAEHKMQSKASLVARGSPPAVAVTRQTSSQSHCSRQNGLLCDQCNKKFKGNEALQAHAATKHPDGPNCSACQHKATSAASLEAHVNEVHRCAVRQDGIVRDAKTPGNHMVEYTHPFRCEICETTYRSAEERSAHFTSSDRHPLCAKCQTGFVDAVALQSFTLYLNATYVGESYSAQSALTDHISTAHSCPVCGEGVFLDAGIPGGAPGGTP
ncbi:hypothetical protein F5141DRAFT_1129111 [Pisolithus sp. B1]|nr:hypothetical protein F5141DRAFT_1129111 [Pisolithus sp. B1]